MKPMHARRFPLLAAAVSLAFIATPVVYPTAAVAQTASQADQVRSYNGQLLKAQSELRRSQTAAQASATRSNAAKILAARATALSQLIAVNPTQAEALAFPAAVLEELAGSFPESASKLEQRGRWSGELEYLVLDDVGMKSHRDVFRLRGSSETLDVGFAGKAPANLRSGQKLSIGGVRVGQSLVAAEVQVTDAAQDGATSATTTATYPATCSTTGPQAALSVLVTFPGYSLPTSVTPEAQKGILLGNTFSTVQNSPNWSVDDFWRQSSDDKTFIDSTNTTVVGPVALTSNFNTDSTGATYCDYYGVRDAVIKAIDGQVDFRRYSRIQVVMPNNGACTWAGIANVGCGSMSSPGDGSFTASVAWLRADQMTSRKNGVMLQTHEIGHNLTLSHAASRDFGAEALGSVGSAGTLSEYGDVHSTMGSWNIGFYAAPHEANQLGWLASGANYQVVETSGTYTIQNYEGRPAGLKALKIRRGTGNDAWLWVESRQNTGIYSSQLSSTLFSGALIHYQDSSTGSKTHLADFTPGTTSFSDSALPVGQTWTDPYSNVSVTVSSVSSTAMTVTVNYGALPCTTSAPTVTASPTGVSTKYGSSAQFAVTVKNNSSSGCSPETFSLAGTVPSGWSSAFASGSLTVGPGQQAQTTMTVGVPTPYTLGTYAVVSDATSSASAKKGSATENVTVTEPTVRLTLNLSGSGSVSLSSPVKSCTSSCTADYSAAANTSVTLTATATSRTKFTGWSGACTGTAATCTVSMGSDKSATATFTKVSGKK